MLVKSLRLKNIRSYTDQHMQFPEGSVLLSGDIGSGKSTILQAIEFALFGLLRGDLSGTGLLRHGEKEGAVELTFNLNGQDITVKRGLKRTPTSVEQSGGHIVLNNAQQPATAQELKAKVFDLLGYPKSLLTKSKNMVYRFTVYTPQEDMKKIILEDTETRLNVLRKVFDIDKYKRIKENTAAYARVLREKKRELDGRIADLPEKEALKKHKQQEFGQAEQDIQQAGPKVKAAQEKVKQARYELEQLEQRLQEAQRATKQKEIAEAELKAKAQEQYRLRQEEETLNDTIPKLESELKDLPPREEIEGKIKIKQQALLEAETKIRELTKALAESTAKQKMSHDMKNKISSLDNCPVCLQAVGEEHKEKIVLTEDEKLEQLEQHMDQHQAQLKTQEDIIISIKQILEDLRKQESDIRVHELKQKQVQEKKQRLQELQHLLETVSEDIRTKSDLKDMLAKELEKYQTNQDDYDAKKKDERRLLDEKERATVEYNKIAEKKKNIKQALDELEHDIIVKQRAQKELETIQEMNHWLTDFFTGLIDSIERHVMSRVYTEFNELFQTWFSTLVEDNMLAAKLDDSFAPVVQQNGYDVGVENLSGGEKTACALAYRLALNKVINQVISSINTKDLLILDEPTDGFSDQQLDKMRDVLSELNAKQVIIVSHEGKIESFVDQVMRCTKHEHISQIQA